jgi:hypothetical protein
MDSRKRQKKREKKKKARLQKQKRARQGLFSGPILVGPPGGEKKMSEVLLEFLEPYMEHAQSEESLRGLVGIGTLAWNAALFPLNQREEIIQKMVDELQPEINTGCRTIVEDMIRRKDAYFADNKRLIVSYDLSMTEAGPHLAVASTPSLG